MSFGIPGSRANVLFSSRFYVDSKESAGGPVEQQTQQQMLLNVFRASS